MKVKDGTSNKHLWIAAWCAVLIVCIAAGVVTRMSYTDFSSDREALMNLPYGYIPYSTEEANRLFDLEQAIDRDRASSGAFVSPWQLIDEADLIVECMPTAKREYSYQSFLTQIHVVKVLKGDESLTGTEIPLYEPLAIINRDADDFQPEAKDTAMLSERFGYAPGSAFRLVQPVQGAYFLGGTLLSESNRYVLFLNMRKYSEAEDRSGKRDEYVLCNSFYAKLCIEPQQTPENYRVPETFISLEESLSYEILALDVASAQHYFEIRDELLEKLDDR